MPTISNDRSDQGVLMYAEHTGDGGSFTLPNGTAGTVQTLTNANYIKSARTLRIGALSDLVLHVSGVISAGMASVTIIIEARRVDPQNGSDAYPFDSWAVIGTVRGDSPSTAPAASQIITRANLAGQSVADGVGGGAVVEDLAVRLMTTDQLCGTEVRVLVKATNAPEAGDVIIIAGNAR